MSTNRYRSRNRERFRGGHAETHASGLTSFDQGSSNDVFEECRDVVGNRGGLNDFDLDRWNDRIGVSDGPDGPWVLKNFSTSWRIYRSEGGVPSIATAATSAISRSNPSRPHIDVLRFLGELKDIPHMVKDLGSYVRRANLAATGRRKFRPTAADVGNGYLGWTFGWAPLISDLGKLFDFNEAVEKRIRELNKLYSERGLSRKVTTYRDRRVGDSYTLYCPSLYGVNYQQRFRNVTDIEQWATLIWRSSSSIPNTDSQHIRDLARQVVFGQSFHPDTAWELLPWSWLIDWFSNVGDVLSTMRNEAGATSGPVCVMTRSECRSQYLGPVENDQQVVFTPNPNHGQTNLQRRIHYDGPTLTAYLPILTGGQQSILSALAVQRFRTGHR